jgi:RimJ/RimL family protein N-acetyltransferase
MPPTREEAQEMLGNWLTHWQRHNYGYWAVALRDMPEVVLGFGGVIYKPYEGLPDHNLYFRLTPSAWGQGYATEIASAALQMAFDELAITAVRGISRLSNKPSRATLEKLGFIQTGHFADPTAPADYELNVVYELNATQWLTNKHL